MKMTVNKEEIIEKLEEELAKAKKASERCENKLSENGGNNHDHYVAGGNRGIFLEVERALKIVKNEGEQKAKMNNKEELESTKEFALSKLDNLLDNADSCRIMEDLFFIKQYVQALYSVIEDKVKMLRC